MIERETQREAGSPEGEPVSGGRAEIEEMCAWAGVSRASYYRHWQASAPREEETEVRSAVQRMALKVSVRPTPVLTASPNSGFASSDSA